MLRSAARAPFAGRSRRATKTPSRPSDWALVHSEAFNQTPAGDAATRLRARVSVVVTLPDRLAAQVRVDLRRAQTLVTQHLLHAPQIRTLT